MSTEREYVLNKVREFIIPDNEYLDILRKQGWAVEAWLLIEGVKGHRRDIQFMEVRGHNPDIPDTDKRTARCIQHRVDTSRMCGVDQDTMDRNILVAMCAMVYDLVKGHCHDEAPGP